MRRLHRKTLYSQDNSLDVRVEQLERRFAGPELEYVLVNFSGGSQTFNAGTQTQLTMDDEEFPFGQYGAANVLATGQNFFGYSVIDDFIQCNTLGKDGFWHLFAGINVTANGPATLDDAGQLQLFIGLQVWDENDVFDSIINLVWSERGIDNRSDVSGGDLWLRTHTMFFAGSILAGFRARFFARFDNDSASNVTATPKSFVLIRYGNALGTITNADG